MPASVRTTPLPLKCPATNKVNETTPPIQARCVTAITRSIRKPRKKNSSTIAFWMIKWIFPIHDDVLTICAVWVWAVT